MTPVPVWKLDQDLHSDNLVQCRLLHVLPYEGVCHRELERCQSFGRGAEEWECIRENFVEMLHEREETAQSSWDLPGCQFYVEYVLRPTE